MSRAPQPLNPSVWNKMEGWKKGEVENGTGGGLAFQDAIRRVMRVVVRDDNLMGDTFRHLHAVTCDRG